MIYIIYYYASGFYTCKKLFYISTSKSVNCASDTIILFRAFKLYYFFFGNCIRWNKCNQTISFLMIFKNNTSRKLLFLITIYHLFSLFFCLIFF